MPVTRHHLARRIAAALAFKAVALLLLWFFFFSPTHRPVIDADRVDAHLFPAPPVAQNPESRHGT